MLEPFTHYGPQYRRGVVENLADVRLFLSRAEPEAAEHYLLLAEVAAGLISWEMFEANDPFRSQHGTIV